MTEKQAQEAIRLHRELNALIRLVKGKIRRGQLKLADHERRLRRLEHRR